MAYPIQLTIGAGNKVSVNYQSQEVNVSVTYQLESEDTDLLHFARDKASEVAAVHGIAWKQMQGNTQAKTATRTKVKSSDETDSKTENCIAESGDKDRRVSAPVSHHRWAVDGIGSSNRSSGLEQRADARDT